MRIACIYFPISSVGGIATVAASLQRAARERGDTFDILRSSNAARIQPGKFSTPQRIRGGDTHITIDGEAPHGATFADTREFLLKNYDSLFFVHPCSHPTKAYGDIPYWKRMYEVQLPKALRFCDGYAETYPWVKEVVDVCRAVYVDQEAYALPLKTLGIKSRLMPQPFFPQEKLRAARSRERLTLFPNQWKPIKCPAEFLAAIPHMEGAVELYSNGIEYYNLRNGPLWRRAIYRDHFLGKTVNPLARAEFFGNVEYPQILAAFARAWSMVDLMGQRAKHAAYKAGAYNYTAVEALWYGCRPILHDLARKSALPGELITTIDLGPKHKAIERIADATNEARPLSSQELIRAREWVTARHSATTLYTMLRKALR